MNDNGDDDEDEGADSEGADSEGADSDGADDGDGVNADVNDNLVESKSPAGAKHMCSICGDR